MDNKPRSTQEILSKVFENKSGKLKGTSLHSTQDYFNAVYDEEKDALRVVVDGGGGGSGSNISIDGETITKNSQDEIQTAAVRETNANNAVKIWVGTYEQYVAQNKEQSDDICYILDDVVEDMEIPVFIQVDDALSSSSTNPVQNKVITQAIANKADKASTDELEEVTSWQVVE